MDGGLLYSVLRQLHKGNGGGYVNENLLGYCASKRLLE